MAVYKKDEYLNALKELVGDRTDDNTLEMIQNFTETYDSMSNQGGEDWQSKYNELKAETDTKYTELDNTWRKKYRDTFFTGKKDESFVNAVNQKEEQQAEESGQGISINDLFSDK